MCQRLINRGFSIRHQSQPVLLHIALLEPTKGIDHVSKLVIKNSSASERFENGSNAASKCTDSPNSSRYYGRVNDGTYLTNPHTLSPR